MMKLITILTLLFCFTNQSKAQGFLRDVLGRPIVEISYVGISGSPFANDDFLNGNVTLNNDDEYENIPLKYNLYNDELYFKNIKDDMLLSFVIPVKSFTIAGQTYMNGFPEIDKFTKKSYYRLLVGDKVKLLSKSYKTILETRPYNSPNIEKSFENQKTFFILKEGKMYNFKPSKKDVLELFATSSTQIEDYLRKEKVNFKSDADLVKLFAFIDRL